MTDQPTPPPTAHTAVTRGPFRDLTAGALVADAALKVHDAIEQWHAMFGTEHDDEPAFRGNIASALYQARMLRIGPNRPQCPDREPSSGVQCTLQEGHETHRRVGTVWRQIAPEDVEQAVTDALEAKQHSIVLLDDGSIEFDAQYAARVVLDKLIDAGLFHAPDEDDRIGRAVVELDEWAPLFADPAVKDALAEIRRILVDDWNDPDSNKIESGIGLVAAEQRRAVEVEGWTPEHDDRHIGGELGYAAACYAMPDAVRWFESWFPDGPSGEMVTYHALWPWHPTRWKPTPDDRIRELVKAGQLIAAEIDRLLRAARGTS